MARDREREVGETGVERRQGHSCFQAGEGRAGAHVRTMAEGDVAASGRAGDVERLGSRAVGLLIGG